MTSSGVIPKRLATTPACLRSHAVTLLSCLAAHLRNALDDMRSGAPPAFRIGLPGASSLRS